uniref:AAA+ ATPase domain-containing protein n=1 Tax=Setaria italica TaxID=4555 RepID=K4A0R2_SETIT
MERAVVSAATGAMSSVLAKLAELLHEKYKLAKGVRKDIEFLRSELGVMNDLLHVMADIEELDALNKGWRDTVRELAYDIEDCIDLSVARLHRAGGDASKGGFFGAQLARKLKKIRVSFQIAHQITELKARVIEESDRHKRYKLDGLIGSSSDASRNKVDLRICALWEETKNLVGLDGPRDEIIRLTVSIVGCAGLGKTTLANQVYQKIQGHFECKAFVSVSQNPNIKDILMKICSQVGATPSMADDELLLVNKLRERLQYKRYIAVVDDIWHSDPWKIIGQALVRTSPGSIIIVTTRLKDVAESCCSSHGGRVYDMRPLDDNDSRRLFFKRIFDFEDKCPHELERASEDILKKCDGIPLAIISISSFLAVDVPQSADHWNKVKESISLPLPGNKSVETMQLVLSLSYFNLPHHLRTCLLYLSAFPEDSQITRDPLIGSWIAEGFVNAEPGESLYEAGLRYFNDLINRSLIQPWCEVRGVVMSCKVHDVILNFLVSKSVEENFLTLSDPSGLPTSLHSKVRRLSIQNSYQENVVSWIKSIKPYIRSLACSVDCKELFPLTEFEVVRVLNLEDCGALTNFHLANVEVLLQLRYLNISGTGVSELPAGIGQVQNLETLDIRCTQVEKLPSTIVQLEKLARLFVSRKVKFPTEGFSKMKALEQLTCFSIHGQSLGFLKELGQLTNLRTLNIVDYEGSRWGIFTSSLQALCSHKLLDVSIYTTEWTPIPMDSSFPALQSLRTFVISTIISLPSWMGLLDLRVLGGMPALETLILYLAQTHAGPFTIQEHEFQHLKSFSVGELYQILFMPGAMPNVKHLQIELKIERDAFATNSYRDDLGIQHLASLTRVDVGIKCENRDCLVVEFLEAKTRSLLDTHPNRPTLIFNTHFFLGADFFFRPSVFTKRFEKID